MLGREPRSTDCAWCENNSAPDFPFLISDESVPCNPCSKGNQMSLLTVNETLSRLRISRSKFYEFVKSGEIRIIKFGKCTRVEQSELDRFVESRRN